MGKFTELFQEFKTPYEPCVNSLLTNTSIRRPARNNGNLEVSPLPFFTHCTVKPLLSGHLRDPPKCPLNRGSSLKRGL